MEKETISIIRLILMTSVLFVSFEYERLRYLVGLPLKNKFYVFVVAASYVWTIFGIISTLINLRFVTYFLIEYHLIISNCSWITFRNMEFLPLTPSFSSSFFQILSLGSILVAKIIVISNILMIAPYMYPIGMVFEFGVIALISYLYGSK